MENSLDQVETSLADQLQKHHEQSSLEQCQAKLMEKIDHGETRSRCNNLHIWGISSDVPSSELENYAQALFHYLLNAPEDLRFSLIELRGTFLHSSSEKPYPGVLMHVHSFIFKELPLAVAC